MPGFVIARAGAGERCASCDRPYAWVLA